MKRSVSFLLLFVALFVLTGQVNPPSTYYLAKTGINTTCAAARSVTTPAATMEFAMNCMIGGDTLIARAGVYEERLHKAGLNGMFPSGSAIAWTTFKAYPGEEVWVRTINDDPWGAIFEFDGGSYIHIDGINWDGYVSPTRIPFPEEYVMLKINQNSHHIKVSNGKIKNLADGWFSQNQGNDNELSGMKGGGYYKGSSYLSGGTGCEQATCWGYFAYWNGLRNKIIGNEVYDIPSWVVHLYCYSPAYCNRPTETLVKDNNFHDYGFGDSGRASGILVASGDANQVITNAVWNNMGYAAIDIGPTATNTIVQGNTYVKPPASAPKPLLAPSGLSAN